MGPSRSSGQMLTADAIALVCFLLQTLTALLLPRFLVAEGNLSAKGKCSLSVF